MPQHYNDVTLIGNMTRDPELRHTDSGTSVCDFGLAINRKYKANGEWQEDATFVEVTCWGSTAENTAEYMDKGSPIFIDGRLSQDIWESDGEKHSKVYVTAETVGFLHGGESGGASGKDDETYDDVAEGDIPF